MKKLCYKALKHNLHNTAEHVAQYSVVKFEMIATHLDGWFAAAAVLRIWHVEHSAEMIEFTIAGILIVHMTHRRTKSYLEKRKLSRTKTDESVPSSEATR